MTPFALRGLDHVVLRTDRLAEMLTFYCDVLGCREERRLSDDIGLVQLRAGAALIDLVTLDGQLGRQGGAGPGTEGRNMDHFCLRIEPFDQAALTSHLAAKHIEASPVADRYGADGNGPSLYIRDPDGNTVELKGPPDST